AVLAAHFVALGKRGHRSRAESTVARVRASVCRRARPGNSVRRARCRWYRRPDARLTAALNVPWLLRPAHVPPARPLRRRKRSVDFGTAARRQRARRPRRSHDAQADHSRDQETLPKRGHRRSRRLGVRDARPDGLPRATRRRARRRRLRARARAELAVARTPAPAHPPAPPSLPAHPPAPSPL